jgi:chemotaxis protein methyltransferase CheR
MNQFLSDEYFEKFSNLIYEESGIHFSESNRSILESRLKERVRRAELSDVGSYFSQIKNSPDEMKILLDSVTTNLTRFFRNTPHFETLEYFVIPELINWKKSKNQTHIKIWSAGCSTGEEPYSLAMIFDELLPKSITFEIIASDLSLKSLLTAKEGFYPETRIQGMPDKYLKLYCEKKNDGFQIKEEIRKKIRFDYHNLKFDSGHKDLDIVFCRNVIIYFDETAQKAVINKFYDAMNNHSYLFIGHSESLFGMNTKFEFLKTDWACIYKKFI